MVAETVETQVESVRQVIGQDDKGRDLVMYGGEPCRVCSNGALQRVRDGVLVGPPTNYDALVPVRTSADATALVWQRWHGKRQEAIRQAVERATGNAMPDIDTADAVIMGDLIETIALNVDVRADHRVKALQLVLEQSGMDGRAPKQAQSIDPVTDDALRGIGAAVVQALAAAALRRAGTDNG